MKGKNYIASLSAAFLAGDMAAGLIRSTPPAFLLPILALSAVAAAVATSAKKSLTAAMAAFMLLGAIAAITGGCPAAGDRVAQRAESARAAIASHLDALAGGGSEGAMLSAIAIGDRSRIDRSLKRDFRSSGAMHLIALSGLHVGVLYLFLSLTLGIFGHSRIARYARKLTILLLLWTYAAVSGMSKSILRAVIMISVYEAGELFGSRRDLERALAISAFVSTLYDPEAPFQIGFQLSYGAMAGICFIYPRIKSLLECRSALMEKLWSTLALSLACQAATAPLVWLYFSSFPKYFMITNLAAIPLTSAAMYLTPLALISENLPLAGDFLQGALQLTLKALLAVIHIIAGL